MKIKPYLVLPIIVLLALVLNLVIYSPDRQEEQPSSGMTDSATGGVEVMATTESTDSTENPTEASTGPQVFTLSFAGDCTFGSTAAGRDLASSFIQTVGDNYDYPFANVKEIFENDDFTMVNLEGPLTEGGIAAEKTYAFRGPTAYTAILTGASVEAVTTANNHSWDYGATGQSDTNAALDAAGIYHAGREGSFLYTTAAGLTIGVYCDDFAFDRAHIADSIAALREKGAEVVVCAFHWGEEASYNPTVDQTAWGHIAIDAGADIVYAHHPHVLQPIEHYGNGVIYYSLGNFSFGGNANPSDMDTAIIQQQFIREADGSLSMGETVIIPCSVSSVASCNNYQPTPLEEGTAAYNRVLSKLDGTYQ